MSGWSTKNYTTYGYDNAANDQNLYGTMQVQWELTAQCAGIFAHTSRMIRPYDAVHADALLNRARNSPPHFSRCYRKQFGHPPSAERQVQASGVPPLAPAPR